MKSLLYLKIPSCAINAYIDIIVLYYDSRKERVLDIILDFWLHPVNTSNLWLHLVISRIIFLITSNSLASVSVRFVGRRLC